MHNDFKIIGIAGPAGCGKDTAADYILSHTPFGYHKRSFADPIKEMCRMGLGLTFEQVHGKLKDTIDEHYGCTPRHMLQTLGTEWGRDLIHQNVWLLAMELKLNQGNSIIPDVRFENEAAYVRENGKLIHIVGRTGVEVEDHISENGIEIMPEDIIIRNMGGLEDFHAYLDEALKWL